MCVQFPKISSSFFLCCFISFTRSNAQIIGAQEVTVPPVTMPPITSPPVATVVENSNLSASNHPLKSDFRCGLDANDARDMCGNICEYPTDCPPGFFCFGSWNTCYTEKDRTAAEVMMKSSVSSLLSQKLQPRSDFRCGINEADARSNCKPECTVNTECEARESCWPTHNNYCHIMPLNHPQCNHKEAENVERRCGYDEMASRGFCGAPCESEADCIVPDEKCFPVHLNLCNCFDLQDLTSENDSIEQNNNDNDNNNRVRHLDGTILRLQIKEMTNRQYFEHAKEPLNEFYYGTNNDTPKSSPIRQNETSSATKKIFFLFGHIASSFLIIVSIVLS